jgi:hypothetical protein
MRSRTGQINRFRGASYTSFALRAAAHKRMRWHLWTSVSWTTSSSAMEIVCHWPNVEFFDVSILHLNAYYGLRPNDTVAASGG